MVPTTAPANATAWKPSGAARSAAAPPTTAAAATTAGANVRPAWAPAEPGAGASGWPMATSPHETTTASPRSVESDLCPVGAGNAGVLVVQPRDVRGTPTTRMGELVPADVRQRADDGRQRGKSPLPRGVAGLGAEPVANRWGSGVDERVTDDQHPHHEPGEAQQQVDGDHAQETVGQGVADASVEEHRHVGRHRAGDHRGDRQSRAGQAAAPRRDGSA